jgi:hypothetical protein
MESDTSCSVAASEDPARISRALVVWIGKGESAWPDHDDARLIRNFGADDAAELLPALRAIEDEFFESDARDRVADLGEMARAAAAEFRDKHPEIAEDAIDALAWSYSYANK